MLKKMAVFAVVLSLGIFLVSACQSGSNTTASVQAEGLASEKPSTEDLPAEDLPAETSTPASDDDEASQSGVLNNEEELVMLQLTPVKEGEELAVIHTSMGDIKVRFFPEEAPKAVENFITHAKDGYYDGVIFHRVINDFMIQGGDPEGTGTGGESIWGGGFESEFSLKLRHFRGALSMAHSAQPNSNGSQFYIVQKSSLDSQFTEYFNELRDNQEEVVGASENGEEIKLKNIFPTEALDEYLKHGGTPHLDFLFNEDGHTVFGQVVEGMDIVDAIAAVQVEPLPQTDPKYGRPIEDVIIERITFERG